MREKLIESFKRLPRMFATKGMIELLADHLIADGVEIPVRCKDCKNWDKSNKELHPYDSEPENKDGLVDFCECLYFSNWSTCHYTRFDDFCSLGERRDND